MDNSVEILGSNASMHGLFMARCGRLPAGSGGEYGSWCLRPPAPATGPGYMLRASEPILAISGVSRMRSEGANEGSG